MLLLAALFAVHLPATAQPLQEVTGWGTNPGRLRLWVVRSSLAPAPGNTCKPLVVLLHGCNQGAQGLWRQAGLDSLAAQLGAILLLPEQRTANNLSGCFNWMLAPDVAPTGGEAHSILQMVEYAQAHYPVCAQRVYVAGLSAGGVMAVSLLALYPQRFAGGVCLAGGPYLPVGAGGNPIQRMLNPKPVPPDSLRSFVRRLNPTYEGPYPRLAIVHGLNDAVADPTNATLLAQQWAHLWGLPLVPELTQDALPTYPNVRLDAYNTPGEVATPAPVQVFWVRGLGHRLPIRLAAGPGQGGTETLLSVDVGFPALFCALQAVGCTP
jgi:feruloyl esterase